MKNILFLTLILITTNVFAQPSIKTNITINAPDYSQIDYELSSFNIYYDYTIVKNIKQPEKAKAGIAILQVGKNYNKFIDVSSLKIDSINEKLSHQATINTNDINQFLAIGFKAAFKYQLILNKLTNQFSYTDNIEGKHFAYNEITPNFDWKMKNESKEILGYQTKKATVAYGGRNWTAWYTEEIPIQFGPYTFNGLPGLILEIYDEKNHYHFTAKAINQDPQQIYLAKTNKDEILVSKAEFMTAEKNKYANAAVRLSGQAIDINGKPIVVKEIPYNPIELK